MVPTNYSRKDKYIKLFFMILLWHIHYDSVKNYRTIQHKG